MIKEVSPSRVHLRCLAMTFYEVAHGDENGIAAGFQAPRDLQSGAQKLYGFLRRKPMR